MSRKLEAKTKFPTNGLSLSEYSHGKVVNPKFEVDSTSYNEALTILMPLFEWREGKGLAIFEWAMKEIKRKNYVGDGFINLVLKELYTELRFAIRHTQEEIKVPSAVSIPEEFTLTDLEHFIILYDKTSDTMFRSSGLRLQGTRIILSLAHVENIETILIQYSQQLSLEIQSLFSVLPTELLNAIKSRTERTVSRDIRDIFNSLIPLHENPTKKSTQEAVIYIDELYKLLTENKIHPTQPLFIRSKEAIDTFIEAAKNRYDAKGFKYLEAFLTALGQDQKLGFFGIDYVFQKKEVNEDEDNYRLVDSLPRTAVDVNSTNVHKVLTSLRKLRSLINKTEITLVDLRGSATAQLVKNLYIDLVQENSQKNRKYLTKAIEGIKEIWGDVLINETESQASEPIFEIKLKKGMETKIIQSLSFNIKNLADANGNGNELGTWEWNLSVPNGENGSDSTSLRVIKKGTIAVIPGGQSDIVGVVIDKTANLRSVYFSLNGSDPQKFDLT